jgi:2-methylisocitrate lyase-like PEP mutase family enzyme
VTSASELVSRGLAFRALHEREGAFIIPNPFDCGSARIFEAAGFEALATSSAGWAFSRCGSDHSFARDALLAHLEEVTRTTGLPVSADLGNGFSDLAEEVGETIRLAAKTGIVGASIEDGTNRADEPLYALALARERMVAASEMARSLPFPFTLTARAENFLIGRNDLDDVIKRLQAYQEAGADVLFAPGVRSAVDIAAILSAIDRPLNVLADPAPGALSLDELSELGVKRVSVGSSIARTAYSAVLSAAREMRSSGTFSFGSQAVPFDEANALFGSRTAVPMRGLVGESELPQS